MQGKPAVEVLSGAFVMLLMAASSTFAADCCTSGDRAFPNAVVHETGPGPVKIVNIFPEHGLTDPHVMIVDDRLYMGMGHDQSWDVEFDWTMDRWEIWSTGDLKSWKKETVIHPNDTYFGPDANCWAGDFAQKDGKYYWYFSNRFYDTGVMVSDQPGGPYRDALGKPLLPNGLTPTKSYDPEVFEEDGKYTIIFGAGTYYAATLGDDMVSLADKPEPIEVMNPDGSTRYTDDKPSVFKRENRYYLVWGAHYAMSDQLRGPYEYKGAFYAGGHGSVFNWKGHWYVVHEHHDISMFYRGIMLKPLYFQGDGTVDLSQDFGFPEGGGRVWSFDNSRMGWRSATGTHVEWSPRGTIKGSLAGRSIIESANWASTETAGRTLHFRLRNATAASRLKLSFAEFDSDRERFWSYPGINWLEEASIEIELAPGQSGFSEYSLKLDDVDNMPDVLKRLRIEFLEAKSGEWEFDYIRIQ